MAGHTRAHHHAAWSPQYEDASRMELYNGKAHYLLCCFLKSLHELGRLAGAIGCRALEYECDKMEILINFYLGHCYYDNMYHACTNHCVYTLTIKLIWCLLTWHFCNSILGSSKVLWCCTEQLTGLCITLYGITECILIHTARVCVCVCVCVHLTQCRLAALLDIICFL
jgi:hypothetical protein